MEVLVKLFLLFVSHAIVFLGLLYYTVIWQICAGAHAHWAEHDGLALLYGVVILTIAVLHLCHRSRRKAETAARAARARVKRKRTRKPSVRLRARALLCMYLALSSGPPCSWLQFEFTTATSCLLGAPYPRQVQGDYYELCERRWGRVRWD